MKFLTSHSSLLTFFTSHFFHFFSSMKIKLSYKLFAAFFLTSLIIVILMIVMQYQSDRNFIEYVNQAELEKLVEFKEKMIAEYQKYRGWDHLKNNRQAWRELLKPDKSERPFPGPEFPEFNDFEEKKECLPPEHPDDPDFDRHPPDKDKIPGPRPPDDPHFRPGPPDGHPDLGPLTPDPPFGRPGPPGPFPDDPFGVRPRLSLFDGQKRPIMGNPVLSDHNLTECVVDGKIVGWLGLRKRKHLSSSTEIRFRDRQYRLFCLAGSGILVLTVLVSFFLSRHLLTPVRKLAEGVKALGSRQFRTRISVRSSDELAELASDFNTMAQAIEKYEKMRQQWLSDISHELRTPLAILRGEIEAMQDGIREMNSESLNSLHSETVHLSRLVDHLHLLSVADSRNFSLKKNLLNPLNILRQTVNMFQTRLNQRKIQVRFDSGDDKDIMLEGDEDCLRQLFSNLLENTVRYTESPGCLKIRGSYSGTGLIMDFEDSGPGVPEESLERLFDRLYRVDKSRSRALGGTGLGLAICKEIVENHGGTIRAENAASGGLRIEIVFPLRRETGNETKSGVTE